MDDDWDFGDSCVVEDDAGEEVLQPEEVATMLRLHGHGWGTKRLAKEFGCARNTARRCLREGGGIHSPLRFASLILPAWSTSSSTCRVVRFRKRSRQNCRRDSLPAGKE